MGACSAADRGAASPGPGRAGFRQISGDPIQIPSRSCPGPAQNPISFLKINHFALLAKGMSKISGGWGEARRGEAKNRAKNLDVMGFEPMTSGLEPASLTTRSTGSLFENGQFLAYTRWAGFSLGIFSVFH